MSKKYQHIIFDLDHTLWDFTANSNETLRELFVSYNLAKMNCDLDTFLANYQRVNDQMWYDYNRKQITKDDIREKRFRLTLASVGIVADDLADAINEDYLRICPSKGHLVPYAMDVLNYLKDNYVMHILTNGFRETQSIKISTSGLEPYFQKVINSESCGYLKPDKQVFDFTLAEINTEGSNCIMIGDDLHADVLGAKNAGIDHIYFNRTGISHSEIITYEIGCLSELKGIL